MKNFNKDTKAISESSLKNQYIQIVDETNIVSKTNPKGIITYVNKKFTEISGYSEEELIGKNHNIVRDSEYSKEFFKELWSTIQSKNVWNGVITNLRKDGTKYTVEASIFPIIDDFGDIVEYIAIRHDITELQDLNKKVSELHNYDTIQQKVALEKLETGIRNNLDKELCNVMYKPSDVLSGDFYSIFKRVDGSIFLYMLDGQGHGISPAMTVFAISSMINSSIDQIKDLNKIITKLYDIIRNFLGEIEQLSYTMLLISSDKTTLSYSSGGMYPFYIKDSSGKVLKIKANNLPFMNFSEIPEINEIKVDTLESLILYTDGIMEHEHDELKSITPESMIKKPESINKRFETINNFDFDDDVTIVYLDNHKK